ncbi:MAG: cytochrome c-type biosis protein CcmE [Solirubrobacteraceae bacterium]|nr:cytochrome c-type biosis protein CcmE [Solirubrobacteraceae bacterium]
MVALTAALLLSGALAYTSFTAAADDQTAGQLLAGARAGQSYRLAGTVLPGSVRHQGATLLFRVRDPKRAVSVPVAYVGEIPDPFREGRGVVVSVRKDGSVFRGEKDSLITKCPSKFQAAPPRV